MRTSLVRALAAFSTIGTPARISKALRQAGPEVLDEQISRLSPTCVHQLELDADDLLERSIRAYILGADDYPTSLASIPRPPGVFFAWGNFDVLHSGGIGMCGSRNVSAAGLAAASSCGSEVAARGLAVFSGYAKGVDTATHLAALEAGGRTAIVLAEGINHFKVKRSFRDVPLDEHHAVVISQFAPGQSWNVGAAMTRNGVIAGLGQALVVIEAGEKGGTLNAGLQALRMGRPVVALEFASTTTPIGNKLLIEKGAVPVRSRQELGRVLSNLSNPPTGSQLRLV